MKNSQNNTNKETVLDIIKILDTRAPNIKDTLEILANVFMFYGVSYMREDTDLPSTITPEVVVEIVMNDIKENGNTLGNSLAMQGVTILEWLSRV